MSYSINEIKALVFMAARGAGYSWGMAQEFAFATIWLSTQGFLACKALIYLFDKVNGHPEDFCFHSLKHHKKNICPICFGVFFSDTVPVIKKPMMIKTIIAPILTLPYLVNYANQIQKSVVLKCADFIFITDGQDWYTQGSQPAIQQCQLEINYDFASLHHQWAKPDRLSRITLTDDFFLKLNNYAHRVYAPNNDRSRNLGAGAGLNDND